jgi:RNA polymerase sigma factor (TIGR02999 family)
MSSSTLKRRSRAAGSRASTVNAALESALRGDEGAMATLFSEIYDELHRIAHFQRRRWSGNHTLDTTALVHESYLKLVDRGRFKYADLRHFFAVAARTMRHLLINYAERQRAQRRGGALHLIQFDEEDAAAGAEQEMLVVLGDGLDHLAAVDTRRATVFEWRFFLGFSVDETAELLQISPATVKRDWTLAVAFLRTTMKS